MTTSGINTTTDTAEDIAREALMELGVLSANQPLRAADGELARRKLHWMLKDWQNDGVNLWRITDATVDIAPGIDAVEITPRVLEVSDVRVVQVTNILDCACDGDDEGPSTAYTSERLLQRVEWAEFAKYPNKLTRGMPTIYTPVPGVDAFSIRVWPVPYTTMTLGFTGFRPVDDVTSLAETIDVPQQYTRTVMMSLAAALAPSFGRASDPNTIVTIREAARLYQIMRAADRPASYFMGSAGARYGAAF
jgi:hypothetical protein